MRGAHSAGARGRASREARLFSGGLRTVSNGVQVIKNVFNLFAVFPVACPRTGKPVDCRGGLSGSGLSGRACRGGLIGVACSLGLVLPDLPGWPVCVGLVGLGLLRTALSVTACLDGLICPALFCKPADVGLSGVSLVLPAYRGRPCRFSPVRSAWRAVLSVWSVRFRLVPAACPARPVRPVLSVRSCRFGLVGSVLSVRSCRLGLVGSVLSARPCRLGLV
jgi:hypothetical protein